jgi:hypothetical protein
LRGITEVCRRPRELADIASAAGWQNQSVHGFLAGQLRKRRGLKAESEKKGAGVTDRVAARQF